MPKFGTQDVCGSTTTPLGKGGPLRASRCIPPGHGEAGHRARIRHPNVSAFDPSPGDVALPAPFDHWGDCAPLDTPTNPARIGCRQGFRALNHDKGRRRSPLDPIDLTGAFSAPPRPPSTIGFHAPWTHEQGLEISLSTCIEPWILPRPYKGAHPASTTPFQPVSS